MKRYKGVGDKYEKSNRHLVRHVSPRHVRLLLPLLLLLLPLLIQRLTFSCGSQSSLDDTKIFPFLVREAVQCLARLKIELQSLLLDSLLLECAGGVEQKQLLRVNALLQLLHLDL